MAAVFVLAALSAAGEDLCFVGGRWFDGKNFRARTFCTSKGLLVTNRPRGARSIDIGGAFVVPPFGEAHNHNVEDSDRLPELIRRYLRNGVFYVKNPNILPRVAPRGTVNKPDSIDAIFAMGGFTGKDGHPAGVMKRNIDRGAATIADADGGFYFEIESLADLDRKWPLFLATKPDFVKTYQVYSEEYAKRREDPAKYAWKGLNPAFLPEIVKRARASGLRVSTHVETAVDFHHAVAADVDEINHLPGFRAEGDDLSLYAGGRFTIADSDARLAARRGIIVVTTVGSSLAKAVADPSSRIVRDVIVRNLETLRRHRVKLAIGSDAYRDGVLPEVMALRDTGVFTNRELLDLWTWHTAQAIFPGRRIGRLARGYEASFLVLDGNPLADFTNVTRIKMRVKDGALLAP